ncbi:hypothetical protein [Cupriavidus sp. CuC1]|uniref:hypothetical protein n=1 Tax=Cupriavidus sp. CuC1 TaxID=3373131 RepID=UPI0037CFCE3A
MDTHFQLEYARELLDTLIANYNATPHAGLGYRSPLDQLDWLADQEDVPLPTADPIAVSKMVGVRKLCTLLGGNHTGRRPQFHFANARYSAEWLCLRGDLLGKKLWLPIENEDDARFATVSTQAGHFLGVVRGAPPWHRTPHSLYIRQAIRGLEQRRLLFLSRECDAVEALLQYAESSPGGRLPPHPAYLEARRILVAAIAVGALRRLCADGGLEPHRLGRCAVSRPVLCGVAAGQLPCAGNSDQKSIGAAPHVAGTLDRAGQPRW